MMIIKFMRIQFEFRIKDKLDIGIFLQPFDIGPYKIF